MASNTHLVLIPSFNTGARLALTMTEAAEHWNPVWVVIDGSTDGTAEVASEMADRDGRFRVLIRPRRGGKGAAVAMGAAAARAAGFTHALAVDADGQHPSDKIAPFMAASQSQPEALILGRPTFGPEAPVMRLYGRKLSRWLAAWETLGGGISDSLFGFRVYPLDPLLGAFAATSFGRGYDFDHEIAVRMCWSGMPVINLDAPCRYLSKKDGGISHFRYLPDNAILTAMNLRLLTELVLWRWPGLIARRFRRRSIAAGLVLLALAGSARAGAPLPPLGAVIAHPATDPAWRDVMPALAAMGDRSCHFEELRHFSFRTAPTTLTGELRFSAQRGLSLQYLTPERRLIIADRGGLVLREGGRTRLISGDEPELGPIAALFPVMQFDLSRLPRLFEIRGRREGEHWTLDLKPRDPRLLERLASVRISGSGPHLQEVALRLTAGPRIQLRLSDFRQNIAFTEQELRTYFR